VQILVLIGLYFLKCTKFDQLIFRKIIKIVATNCRCQILTLKCTKIDFAALPQRWGGEGRGGEGREWEGALPPKLAVFPPNWGCVEYTLPVKHLQAHNTIIHSLHIDNPINPPV